MTKKIKGQRYRITQEISDALTRARSFEENYPSRFAAIKTTQDAKRYVVEIEQALTDIKAIRDHFQGHADSWVKALTYFTHKQHELIDEIEG